MNVRKQIRQWAEEFKESNGRMPTSEDKRQCPEVVALYAQLKELQNQSIEREAKSLSPRKYAGRNPRTFPAGDSGDFVQNLIKEAGTPSEQISLLKTEL